MAAALALPMSQTCRAPARCDAVEDRPPLDRRDAAGHADQHPRLQPPAGRLRLAEEVAEHRLAELEIGDHAVAQRTNDGDALGRAAFHLPGEVPDRAAAGEDAARARAATATTEGSSSRCLRRPRRSAYWPSPGRWPGRSGSIREGVGASLLTEIKDKGRGGRRKDQGEDGSLRNRKRAACRCHPLSFILCPFFMLHPCSAAGQACTSVVCTTPLSRVEALGAPLWLFGRSPPCRDRGRRN